MEKDLKGPNVMFGQNLNQQRMALFKGLTAKAHKAENLNMQALQVAERDFDAPKPKAEEVDQEQAEDSEFDIEEEEKAMEDDEEKAKDLEKE